MVKEERQWQSRRKEKRVVRVVKRKENIHKGEKLKKRGRYLGKNSWKDGNVSLPTILCMKSSIKGVFILEFPSAQKIGMMW